MSDRRVVTQADIDLLRRLAHDGFHGGVPSLFWDALRELEGHRQDSLARGSLPAHVGAQPSEGKMWHALVECMLGEQAAAKVMAGVIREVLTLRETLTRAQDLATKERDLRLDAERKLPEIFDEQVLEGHPRTGDVRLANVPSGGDR